MKRNNLFMFSYIVFIFVCVVVRVFCEYPMWNTLIAAISFSSGMFAVADFFSGRASAELEASKVTKKLFDQTEKIISAQLKKVDTELNSGIADQIGPECHVKVKSELHNLKDENSKIDKMYDDNIKNSFKYGNYSNVFNFLGFFSFSRVVK